MRSLLSLLSSRLKAPGLSASHQTGDAPGIYQWIGIMCPYVSVHIYMYTYVCTYKYMHFFYLRKKKNSWKITLKVWKKSLVFYLHLPGIFLDWFQLANIEKKDIFFFRSPQRWKRWKRRYITFKSKNTSRGDEICAQMSKKGCHRAISLMAILKMKSMLKYCPPISLFYIHLSAS